MAKAIDKVREFANSQADIGLAMSGQFTGEVGGMVDLSEVEGFDSTMPIQTSLSEIDGEQVAVVNCAMIENQFANDRLNASKEAAEFIFMMRDSRFYRAVSSNALALKNAAVFIKLLSRFSTVNAEVYSVDVKGQTNKAYGFRGTLRKQS